MSKNKEREFLNSDIYSHFRSLICSERILLANVYFRFAEVDLRPLLAGCLDCSWDEKSEMFFPQTGNLKETLISYAALAIKEAKSTEDLNEFILALGPTQELLICHQGAVVGGQTFYTDMCVYNQSPSESLVSIIREGMEGFNFKLTSQHLDAQQIAFNQEVFILKQEKLVGLFEDVYSLISTFQNKHNKSIEGDLESIKKVMYSHVSQMTTISNVDTELLPTYIALKLCGPICWYFNRFVQSCYGLHDLSKCFTSEQLSYIEKIEELSGKTRNMGLKLSRSQRDKDKEKLVIFITDLINHIDSLNQLIIS